MSFTCKEPKLRFQEFSGEWETSKLEKYCIKIASGKSKKEKDGKYNLYGSTGIIGKTNEYSNDGKFILIARVGANAGLTNIVNGTFGVTDNTLVIDLNDNVEIDFVLSLLKKYNLNKLIFGSGQPLITGGQLKNLKLAFPPKQEQEKIASFLSSVDVKIEQLSKKKTLLAQYKKGVMQKIFSQKIHFRDDDGSEYPEWVEKKLGEVVKFANGKGHEQSIDEHGEYIVVNSKFIASHGHSKKYTKNLISPISKDSIVMVMSDVPKGKALAKCFYIDSDNSHSLNQRICSLKSKEYNNKYLFYILNRNPYYLQFDSGVGQTNLRKDEVLDCPMKISVSFEEQTKIANFLSSIDEKLLHVEKQLDVTKQFKKGLLQKMFV